ncbi:nicotinamide-nucleotide adenylyltransferase [Candidatus Woesearchaeota archaeon]|nr:nicotinamide-nucleotide adenylyltransferase [Candidatus Woesearchaeota archaeon]
MTIALFIGRFQPFHIGHFNVIKKILEAHDSVIIVIGSTQEKETSINPFSADERRKMIELALKEDKITKYKIVYVSDIHNNKEWVSHLERYVEPYGKFDIVYTGSELTKKLFKEAGYKVHWINERINGVSASEIRLRIAKKMVWEHMVPASVSKYIRSINSDERIRRLSEE